MDPNVLAERVIETRTRETTLRAELEPLRNAIQDAINKTSEQREQAEADLRKSILSQGLTTDGKDSLLVHQFATTSELVAVGRDKGYDEIAIIPLMTEEERKAFTKTQIAKQPFEKAVRNNPSMMQRFGLEIALSKTVKLIGADTMREKNLVPPGTTLEAKQLARSIRASLVDEYVASKT